MTFNSDIVGSSIRNRFRNSWEIENEHGQSLQYIYWGKRNISQWIEDLWELLTEIKGWKLNAVNRWRLSEISISEEKVIRVIRVYEEKVILVIGLLSYKRLFARRDAIPYNQLEFSPYSETELSNSYNEIEYILLLMKNYTLHRIKLSLSIPNIFFFVKILLFAEGLSFYRFINSKSLGSF